ncbi:MAG TPA: Na-translocating system protein MpsC family protein [Baekduia sp.]|uniref:Na-translocating system protein MpsC family protein n=1 Tax=Baekduia sp. TaxID=2600305 RepID=UPI002C65F31B|nr:Na-translocating system protein MpsC family protein [Baekduia sp.]HMJ35055.1 Na-translocating system protein MpsC family protein [Baekduia sp.]
MSPTAQIDEVDESGQTLTTQISNEIVRLYKDLFGRGPTRARTNYAGPDTIITSLENSLTPAERSLAELGEHQRLRDIRMFFQHARERDLCDAVERLTGREVRAFVSGIDTVHDVSSEVFYLGAEKRNDRPRR